MSGIVLLLSAALLLPGEACTNAPLSCAPFPDRLSAFVWRNWFCVPKERLAETVGADVAAVTAVATEMGLPAEPSVPDAWRDAGYVTVMRRNWHLLDYDQLLVLLGWDREKMRYHLLFDDYLFSKLGALKPKCGELKLNPAAIAETRGARRRLAAILKEEGADDFAETPRFAFRDDLSAPLSAPSAPPPSAPLRISSGYYADCLDPLWDDEIASFSDGLLARYAAAGVNGVWLHVVLATLAKDPFFTEFGDGAERRQRNLKKLVDRAAKYGLKVYLYFNEPRPMPPAFFERNAAYRACRGTTDWTGRVAALCPRAPEVRRWLRASIGEVFRAAPGLGGVFTISASENLVHCLAHGDKAFFEKAAKREPTCRPDLFCPRCERTDFETSAAELNTLLADAVHAAAPSARVFVWDWGWSGKTEDFARVGRIVSHLPTNNVSFLTVSARGKEIDVDGTRSKVNEYTLSQIGPSEASRRKWALARAAGLGLAVKAQASGSWEIASVPYIPVMDNVAAHAWNLMREGVGDALLSWTCGTYPAPNLKVFNGVRPTDAGPGDVLVRVSEELYGPKAAPAARQVWTILSEGFARYPFQSRVLYHGPHHLGPANPLYPVATGYASTMTGIPYDDLDGWRRLFPRETYVARFQQMADAFVRGAAAWKNVIDFAEGDGKRLAEDEFGLIRTIALSFASTADQARFVMARERGDTAAMRAVAARELVRARDLLPLVRRDARLGFEGASQYFFLPQDLREKILDCRQILSPQIATARDLPEVQPDLGGVTYDFAAISEKRQAATAGTGENWVAAANATGLVRWVSAAVTGERVCEVTLPHVRGGRYRLSCSYRRRASTGAWGGCLVQFLAGGKVLPALVKLRMQREGAAWQRGVEEFEVEPGVDRLRLSVRLRGAGELEYRDLCLASVAGRSDGLLSLVAMPAAFLDGRFAVASGQCGLLIYQARAEESVDWRRVACDLRLPPGYACLGKSVVAEGPTRAQVGVLVSALPDAAEGPCTLALTRDGAPVSETARVTLYTVPAVRAAAVPKRYHVGLNIGADFTFREPEALEAFGRMLGEAGAGWLIAEAGTGARLLPFWRKYGHGPYTPYSMSVLKDGYRVGPEAGRPAEDRFVADERGGRDASHIRRATCPVAVYEERAFFRTNSLPALAAIARGADGLWANWEPYRFAGRGCFCASCCRAFADFAGLPRDEVAAVWPAAIQKGGKWASRAAAFRSREHARLVGTVDREVRALTGGDASLGFIPGVAWPEMSGAWRELSLAEEVRETDYAGSLRWINPWGPYPAWSLSTPYAYDRRLPLLTWCAARDVCAAVARDYPARSRPKLLGFAQGLQCGDQVVQPEALEQELDAFFFNRWDAAVVYYFPHGYDARHWQAFAAATERAAACEAFVRDGRCADAVCTVTPVAEYAVPAKGVSMYLKTCRDQSPLQYAAFEKDGASLVAVLNHWMRGEAFFDLRLSSLPAGTYAVTGDGLLWAKSEDDPAWTAEELARGLRLMVGAARTVPFRIRPWSEVDLAHLRGRVTQSALQDLYDRRRPQLRRLAAEEAADESHRGFPSSDSL